jgi:hypothetical protein
MILLLSSKGSVEAGEIPVTLSGGSIEIGERLKSRERGIQIDRVCRVAGPTKLYGVVGRVSGNHRTGILRPGCINQKNHSFTQNRVIHTQVWKTAGGQNIQRGRNESQPGSEA